MFHHTPSLLIRQICLFRNKAFSPVSQKRKEKKINKFKVTHVHTHDNDHEIVPHTRQRS